MKKIKVTFIGLGVMGFPMAGHLSHNGYDVCVYNRNIQKAKKWKNIYKGNFALTPSEAVLESDFIMTCVGQDQDLKEVYEGKNGILKTVKKGAIIIDHTTASAKIAKYLYKKCKSLKVGFLDAPISGGQAGAENGKLSIMIGGDKKIYNKSKDILFSYGKTINLIGPSGSGQLCKMVNQICIAGLVQGLSEALIFGKKSKLNMNNVLSVISKGAAQSWQMDNRATTMINNKFNFGFAVDWMCKDLKICFNHSKLIRTNLPITKIIYKYYKNIQKNGGNRWDTSSLISLLK
tara:strand:- start:1344 stop:2213 length:870 start_codon:yes stop_codon:yes gene_type:complete